MKYAVLWLTLWLSLAEGAEKNIIFVITDDESPTLGCYGDPVAVTPHIDALAADGALFHNAFATTASCSASRSVVLSGLHNHKNGQFGHQHHFHKFASFHGVASLALPRVLANEGYRTAQIGKYHVAPEEVYHFDHYLKGNGRNALQMANEAKA
ncbi:MAG: sulfatase-like hydrolase/transferase, partial [Verrucomicrobiota bacterium]